MPSVWDVGKLSFSLDVSRQLVPRSTLLNASERAVSVLWLPALWMV